VNTIGDTGKATVSLIAGTTSGSVKVDATSNSVKQSVYVGIGGAPVAIALEADPPTIPADGSSSSSLTATVTDGNGDPVTPGTTVVFSIAAPDLGATFSNSATIITVNTIGDTGKATVSLIAGTTNGSVKVDATSNSVKQSVYVGIGGAVSFIELEAAPTTIPSDGSSSSSITATVTDGNGDPVTPGTAVVFSIAAPDLGATFSNGATGITVNTIGDTGKATVPLIAGTTNGSVKVDATSNSVKQSVYVGIGGAPVAIALKSEPGTIPADGSSSTAITATVTDGSGNPVTPGTEVEFEIIAPVLGTTFHNGATTITVTANNTEGYEGKATVSLIAGTTIGSARVDVTCNGVSQSIYVGIGTAAIGLVAVPVSIPADGISSSEITATIVDSAGDPVPMGTPVEFQTSLAGTSFPDGNMSYATSTIAENGVAIVSLKGTSAGITEVTCFSSGVSQLITVEFTAP